MTIQDAAEAVAGVLAQAGFDRVTLTQTGSFGYYSVDFSVHPEHHWETRNIGSSIMVTEDGIAGGASIRPPGAPKKYVHRVRRACEAAVNAPRYTGGWSWHLSDEDGFGDPMDDVRPHIERSSVHEPDAQALAVAKDVRALMRAYRRSL